MMCGINVFRDNILNRLNILLRMMLNYSIILLLIISLASCSSAIYEQNSYVHAYQSGQLAKAEDLIDTLSKSEMPRDNYLHSKDAVWILLDRATIAFAKGEMTKAIHYYNQALEALDYYDQECRVEKFEQILLQDDTCAYTGDDYEQILARIYLALALLQSEDFSNALALLRQAEDAQEKKIEYYRQVKNPCQSSLILNPLAKYLLGLISEKKKDLSNANLLYDQVSTLLSQEQVPQEFFQSKTKHTLLIVLHNGQSPYKISTTTTGSIASAAVLETLLGCHGIEPAWSSLSGIPVPMLVQNPTSSPTPLSISVGNDQKFCFPFFNVTSTAFYTLEQKKPTIVGRGLARLIFRRSAVAYAEERDPSLGALTDIAMYMANINTQADVRMWRTLPGRIDLARFELDSGDYVLEIIHPRAAPPFRNRWKIHIGQHPLNVINIFNLNPNMFTTLIPQSLHGEPL